MNCPDVAALYVTRHCHQSPTRTHQTHIRPPLLSSFLLYSQNSSKTPQTQPPVQIHTAPQSRHFGASRAVAAFTDGISYNLWTLSDIYVTSLYGLFSPFSLSTHTITGVPPYFTEGPTCDAPLMLGGVVWGFLARFEAYPSCSGTPHDCSRVLGFR